MNQDQDLVSFPELPSPVEESLNGRDVRIKNRQVDSVLADETESSDDHGISVATAGAQTVSNINTPSENSIQQDVIHDGTIKNITQNTKATPEPAQDLEKCNQLESQDEIERLNMDIEHLKNMLKK